MNDDDKRQRRKLRPGRLRWPRPDPDKLTHGVKLVAPECLASAGDLSPRPTSLNLAQYEFCLNYLANGFNGTAAYTSAYPGATVRSARELGHDC